MTPMTPTLCPLCVLHKTTTSHVRCSASSSQETSCTPLATMEMGYTKRSNRDPANCGEVVECVGKAASALTSALLRLWLLEPLVALKTPLAPTSDCVSVLN